MVTKGANNFFFLQTVGLPGVRRHDAASSATLAARVVVIHAQVVAHLMGHHSGGANQVVVGELQKTRRESELTFSRDF